MRNNLKCQFLHPDHLRFKPASLSLAQTGLGPKRRVFES
jgi:hypothetical protein